jgi:hypothetical protein
MRLMTSLEAKSIFGIIENKAVLKRNDPIIPVTTATT